MVRVMSAASHVVTTKTDELAAAITEGSAAVAAAEPTVMPTDTAKAAEDQMGKRQATEEKHLNIETVRNGKRELGAPASRDSQPKATARAEASRVDGRPRGGKQQSLFLKIDHLLSG